MLHISNTTRAKNHKNYLRKLTQKRRSIEKRQNQKEYAIFSEDPFEEELVPYTYCTCQECECDAFGIADTCVCSYCPIHG